MADRHVAHLLIGGGIASAAAATTLRAQGATGDILLVGRELDPPYHRPPLSKGYLAGAEDRASTAVALADDVEVLTRTSVTKLDPEAREATLSTRQTVSYDSALLATGAMVRRLGLDGADLDGIHYLRALGNADAIRADLEGRDRVVLVGGSYVGCEVAATLTGLGKRCTIVLQEDEPLERHFGARVGRFFRGVLEEHGVALRGGVDVTAFAPGEDGRVGGVALAGGEVVAGDAVVCGVGSVPDVGLAKRAGLAVGGLGGVLCDAALRTSAAGLWAAGDMCEYASVVHGRELRVEHADHAARQGATAARGMLGAAAPHADVPWFWSDVADWARLEYVGPALDWADEAWEGEEADGAFAVTYRDARGDVVAMLGVNGAGDLDDGRRALLAQAGLAA